MDMISAYKGIAPGKIILRGLKKRSLTQREVAAMANMHYQTLNAIISGRREITIEQSLELDKALGFERGFLAVIQTYYKVGQCSGKQENTRPHPVVRPYVFWDVDMAALDWEANREFIVQRVNERGNKSEIESVRRYYGEATE